MTLSGTGAVSESTRKLYESQLVTRRCPLIFILLFVYFTLGLRDLFGIRA